MCFGKADPDVEGKRPGDLFGEEAAKAAAVYSPQKTAAKPADGQRVVAAIGVGIGGERLGGEQRLHLLIIGKILEGQSPGGDAWQSSVMGDNIVHQHASFGVGGE